MNFDRSLYRGEYHNAHAITYILQSYPRLHNRTNQSVEVQIQSIQCLALNYIYSQSWDKAISLTKKLCTLSTEAGLHPYHAKFLLQLASIYVQSAPKNALVSLPIVLQCIKLCQQYAMDSLHAYALFILAKVHLLSNNVKKALILLKGCICAILQHSSIEIQGDLYLTLCKCYMTNVSLSDTKKKIVKSYTAALNHIQKAIQLFQKIQVPLSTSLHGELVILNHYYNCFFHLMLRNSHLWLYRPVSSYWKMNPEEH